MDRDEFKILVKAMKSVYAQTTFLPDSDAFNVWYELLKDLPYKMANLAVQEHMRLSRYIPTIADIRERAEKYVILDFLGKNEEFEKAWMNTYSIYPKKTDAGVAKWEWGKKILSVPEREREQIAIDIFCATKEYLGDFRKNCNEDYMVRFLPEYAEWLKLDCDYWIKIYEEKRKSASRELEVLQELNYTDTEEKMLVQDVK